jgi:hypothetical protein
MGSHDNYEQQSHQQGYGRERLLPLRNSERSPITAGGPLKPEVGLSGVALPGVQGARSFSERYLGLKPNRCWQFTRFYHTQL